MAKDCHLESDFDYLDKLVHQSASMSTEDLQTFSNGNGKRVLKPITESSNDNFLFNENQKSHIVVKTELYNELYKMHLTEAIKPIIKENIIAKQSVSGKLKLNGSGETSSTGSNMARESKLFVQAATRKSKIEDLMVLSSRLPEIHPDNYDYLNVIFEEVSRSMEKGENAKAETQKSVLEAKHQTQPTDGTEVPVLEGGSLNGSLTVSKQNRAQRIKSIQDKFERNKLDIAKGRAEVRKNSISSVDDGEHPTFELVFHEDEEGKAVFSAEQHESIASYNEAQRLKKEAEVELAKAQGIFCGKLLDVNEAEFSASDRPENEKRHSAFELHESRKEEGEEGTKAVDKGPKFKSVVKKGKAEDLLVAEMTKGHPVLRAGLTFQEDKRTDLKSEADENINFIVKKSLEKLQQECESEFDKVDAVPTRLSVKEKKLVKKGDRIRELFERLSVSERYELEIAYKNKVMIVMNELLSKQKFSKGSETTALLKQRMREMVTADFLYYCSQLTAKQIQLVVKVQNAWRAKILHKIHQKVKLSNLQFAMLKNACLERRTVLLRQSHLK